MARNRGELQHRIFPAVSIRHILLISTNLPDKTLLKKIRRSDAVSKMSVLAAADALANSGIRDIAQKKLGIILATAFGPHVTTFNFLDDILDHGDAAVSPTTFSNSVHNAAASYIAMSLNIKGPTLTITQFQFSFQAGAAAGAGLARPGALRLCAGRGRGPVRRCAGICLRS